MRAAHEALLRRRRRLALCDNVAFKNGKGNYGGAIYSKVPLRVLIMLCLMETLRRNMAVLFFWAEAAVASETAQDAHFVGIEH